MIVKAPAERYPTAPEGTFPAVCVDNIDMGDVTTKFGKEERTRHMVRLVWQLEERDHDGKRFLVKQDFTASLHEKAALTKCLQTWRGRVFTPAELFCFDLDNVIGVGCLLCVVHNTGSKGGTFANVAAVMKLPKTMEAPVPMDYVRVKDRVKAPPQTSERANQPRQQSPVEEMPPRFDDFEVNDSDSPF